MDNTKVYAMRLAGDDEFASVAMRCELRDDPGGFKGLCFLTPPDRGHMIEGALVEETGEEFKFKSTGYAPGVWEFQALTIDNFRKRFYKLVIDGEEIGQSVNTTEELYEWFNREFPL